MTSSVETGPPGRLTPPSLLRWVLLALGCGLFALFLWRTPLDQLWAACLAVGPGIALIIAAPLFGFGFHASAWLVLMPAALRPPPGRAFAVYLAAQAVDDLGGGVAGEPLKVLAMAPGARMQVASVVALENLARLGSFALFFCLGGTVLALWGPRGVAFADLFRGAMVVMAIAGVAAVVVLVGPWGVASRLAKHPRLARLGKLAKTFDAISRGGRQYLRRHPARFVASTLLHFAGKLMIVPEIALVLYLLGHGDLVLSFWLGVASVVGQVIGAPVPGHLGSVEGMMVLVGEMFGATLWLIMAVAVLRRIRSLFWLAVGFGLMRRVLRGRAQ